MSVIWFGKPYMKKTVVKFVLIFLGLSLLFSPIFYLISTFDIEAFVIVLGLWVALAGLYFVGYYFNKKAYTFNVTDKSVRVVLW